MSEITASVKPLLVLIFLPVLVGFGATMLFRGVRSASLAATIGAPAVVYFCLKALDPEDTWSWLAAFLVAPLVISLALVTVLLWFGRSRARKRRSWNGA